MTTNILDAVNVNVGQLATYNLGNSLLHVIVGRAILDETAPNPRYYSMNFTSDTGPLACYEQYLKDQYDVIWSETRVHTKQNDDPTETTATVTASDHFIVTNKARNVYVEFGKHNEITNVAVYALNEEFDIEPFARALAAFFPPMSPQDSDSITVGFWSLASNGPRVRYRTLQVHMWDSVREHYSADVAKNLDIMSKWKAKDFQSGSLILFHGQPGTGKTNAIRALIREWKDWCDVEYVMDPENFFGDAHYMAASVLNTEDILDDRWRILLIEDANELIQKDAKQMVGQGLSRLLNLCDGFIGQGINILVLITTNENVGDLHPAIVRPGRCRANIHIGQLSAKEANAWRIKREIPTVRSMDPSTLAELFAESMPDKQLIISPEDHDAHREVPIGHYA